MRLYLKPAPAMFTAMYAALLLACTSVIGIFGFLVGRCARKLPVIDDNLPWAIHRSRSLSVNDGADRKAQ